MRQIDLSGHSNNPTLISFVWPERQSTVHALVTPVRKILNCLEKIVRFSPASAGNVTTFASPRSAGGSRVLGGRRCRGDIGGIGARSHAAALGAPGPWRAPVWPAAAELSPCHFGSYVRRSSLGQGGRRPAFARGAVRQIRSGSTPGPTPGRRRPVGPMGRNARARTPWKAGGGRNWGQG